MEIAAGGRVSSGIVAADMLNAHRVARRIDDPNGKVARRCGEFLARSVSEVFFVLKVAKLMLLQHVVLPLLLILLDGRPTVLFPKLVRPGMLGRRLIDG